VFDDGQKVGPFDWSGDNPDQALGEYARGTLVLPEGLTIKMTPQMMRQSGGGTGRANKRGPLRTLRLGRGCVHFGARAGTGDVLPYWGARSGFGGSLPE